MRKELINGSKLAIALVVLGGTVGGCLSNNTSNDQVDQAVQAPSNPSVATVLNGFVQDGKSLTGVSSINVTVAAADQSKVVADEDGDYTFADEDGVISIALKDSVVPTEANPVSITLVAKAGPDYIDSSTVVYLTSPGVHEFAVNMVAIAAPPAGVQAARSAESGAVSGVGATTRALAASSADGSAPAVSINMPVNTTLTDASGAALKGDLTIDVAHHDSGTADALATFPGTLTARIDNAATFNSTNPRSLADGDAGNFVSGGFTSITVTDAAGKVAHNVNGADASAKPLTLKVKVSADTVNPDTNALVKAGDTLPVWSYDNETGVWKFEANGTVTAEGTDLFVTYTTNHLSFYNLDWYQGKVCHGVKLNLVNGGDSRLRVRLVRVGGGFEATLYYTGEGDVIKFNYAPVNMPVNVFVEDALTGAPRVIASGSPIADLCAQPLSHTITLQPKEQALASLKVTALAVCKNGAANPTPLPSASVSVLLNRKLVNTGTTNSSGIAQVGGLTVGESYKVVVVNNSTHGKGSTTVDVSSLTPSVTIEVPQKCKPATGATGSTGATGAGGGGI